MDPSWKREFIRPFNVFSIVIAVFGIGIGWYFGIQSTETISVLFSEDVTKLYDASGVGSILSVSDKSGKKIISNVYSDTITVTNTGTIRLDNSRVRIPLRINISAPLTTSTNPLDPGQRIVGDQIRILSATIQDNQEKIYSLELKDQEIVVLWKYLDPGISMKIILICSSANPIRSSYRLVIDSRSDYIRRDSDFESLSQRVGPVGNYLIATLILVSMSLISAASYSWISRKITNKTLMWVSVIVTSSVSMFVILLLTDSISNIQVENPQAKVNRAMGELQGDRPSYGY